MIALFLLLCLAAALVLAGSRDVVAWWYRLMHDEEPYDPAFADVVDDLVSRYRAGEAIESGAPREAW